MPIRPFSPEQQLRHLLALFDGKVGRESPGRHVETGPGNMTADVLPAVQFKNYTYFYAANNEGFDEGLEFVDTAGNYTVNYPKVHIKNGEAKNSQQQTNGHYKPAVRMFKNARNRAVERGFFRDGGAPSYFVECFLFNVLNSCS